MREFMLWLFEKRATPCEIALFNFWHIFYFALIIAAAITAGVFLKKATDETKTRVFSILSITLVALYVFDWFAIPLYNTHECADGSILYMLDVDKLPFHICTILCPVVAFVQFNKKCARFREPVAILAIVAPLMYLTYPGSAVGDLSAFCYKVIQTFLYHGVLLAWGYLNLATGVVRPAFKRCYKVLIGICLIAVWAMIGNLTYGTCFNHDGDPHYDWFFLTGSTFPFVPKPLMPFAVIAAVFCVALLVYGIYYLVLRIQNGKKVTVEEAEEKEEVTV